ncbi:kidins220 [Symbiodinium sp. CCMP2592]|nr:kidins220 [Symbiodinium sp. CCMP2592]
MAGFLAKSLLRRFMRSRPWMPEDSVIFYDWDAEILGTVPGPAGPVVVGHPADGNVPAAAAALNTWVALEDVGPHTRGDVIAVDPGPLPQGHIILGDRTLVPVGNLVLSVRKVSPDQVANARFDDLRIIRILPVQFDAQGIRRREFNAAMALMQDTSPQGGGLQLQGPASLLNVLKMMREQSFTPSTFHEFWVRSSELFRGDRSVYEHECLSRVLEAMITVDQLNVPCLQAAELIGRRLQVIREAHRISPGAPDYSAADVMMGWEYRKAGQGIDAGLAAHVASELKNEAAIAKEARKAREEADLRRRKPNPKSGAKGGGGDDFTNFDGEDRNRDLFPIPMIQPRDCSGLSSSTSRRRRAARFNRKVKLANDVLGALNEMYRQAGTHACSSISPTTAQYAAQGQILQQVDRVASKIPLYSEREATRSLLQSCLSYNEEDLVDDFGRDILKVEEGLGVTPYMDVVLKRDSRKYVQFVHSLYLGGMIAFTDQPKDLMTPFFVAKKSGKLRLVLDCRGVNQRFKDPPSMMLAAGSSWSSVEVPDGQTLFVAQSDITDYFYSLRSLGFGVHEEMDACSSASSLGFFIDGVEGTVTPIPDKVGRVIAAFKRLSPRPRVTGQAIEKLVGHAVHFMMLRRELLACMRSLYDFYSFKLPESREAVDFCSACVAEIARRKEGWRFQARDFIAPREKAFTPDQKPDPFSDPDTVIPCHTLPQDPFAINPDFDEVPAPALTGSEWFVAFAAHTADPEPITVIEARGVVAAIRHKKAKDKRHIKFNSLLTGSGEHGPLAETKEEKAVKRQKLISRTSSPRLHGQTFLEQVAVSAPVAADYASRLRRFMEARHIKDIRAMPEIQLDESLSIYLNNLFEEGADVSEGSKVFAAVLDARPGSSQQMVLPRSRRCLKGWSNMDPGKTRPPIPFALIALIALDLLDNRIYEAFLIILIMFSAYLRPGEALCIRSADLVRPTRSVRHFTINLQPADRWESSKTGLSDETIVLDSPLIPHLGRLLGQLANRRAGLPLFTLDYRMLRFHWQQALVRIGRRHNHAVLYQLRHSGPSHDRLHNLRTFKPARWKRNVILASGWQNFHFLTRLKGTVGFGTLFWLCSLIFGIPYHTVGFNVAALDIAYGDSCDLRRHTVQRQLFNFMRSHLVVLVWLGFPGTSWSPGHKHDGLARPPLRDDLHHLWGRPGLSRRDQAQVDNGNKLLAIAIQVIHFCRCYQIPWALENPISSLIWQTPQLQQLALACCRNRRIGWNPCAGYASQPAADVRPLDVLISDSTALKILVAAPADEIKRICPGPGRILGAGAVLRLGGSVLGGYGEADINYAYRQLSRALHPDKNPDIEEAHDAFKRLTDASAELKEGLEEQRNLLRAICLTMGTAVTPEMLERPQEALFAEATRMLHAVLALTGEGEVPGPALTRSLASFTASTTWTNSRPQVLLAEWFDMNRLLDLFGTPPLRTAYDCAPKRYRAFRKHMLRQFLCAMNRATLAEAKRNNDCVRGNWQTVMMQYPEIGLWRDLREKIKLRVWTPEANEPGTKTRRGSMWDDEEGKRTSTWATLWRDRIRNVLPRGIDSFVGAGDKEVRMMAAALWKDITEWAKGEGDCARHLNLFTAEPPANPDETAEAPEEWAFVPAADIFLVVGEGIVGITAEGLGAADAKPGHDRMTYSEAMQDKKQKSKDDEDEDKEKKKGKDGKDISRSRSPGGGEKKKDYCKL